MAKARLVVADQNSAELDQIRRGLNALMVVLENVASEVDAGNITADEAFTALLTTLSTGLDSTIASIDGGANTYTGTEREVVGCRPTPLHPKQVRGSLRSMSKDDDF